LGCSYQEEAIEETYHHHSTPKSPFEATIFGSIPELPSLEERGDARRGSEPWWKPRVAVAALSTALKSYSQL